MAHSMATFMAFYHANKIEDWTCNNLVEYYRDKTEKKDWKKVLDWIKKDLVRVTRSDSEFDTIRRGKAQEILDKWKDWTTFYNDIIRKDCAHVNMRVRTISTISQLNNLTGDSTQNFDNCLITSGKRDREETERSSPRLKKKAFSSGSSDTRNYFSQIRSEQNEQDQRPRTPEHRIYSSGAMPSWNRENKSDNGESQELCDSDSDPISDHKLLDELSEELKGLGAIELTIRDTLLEILRQNQSKDLKSGKTLMNSNFLNGIIDVSNANLKKMTRSILNKLNEGQQWFDQVLNKQTWASTSEFIDYCNQFTDHVCNRVQFPTLVRKSFVTGHFDPFVHEGHDIAQDIMKHFSVRLEAPCNISSKSSKLERTYAIDTIIYVMNRIFRMHFDVLDENWIEILTRDTKSHKIDGVLKVFQTKKFTQTIIIMEFSYGQYASEDKDTDDQ
ncbi:12229_t:CDS:2, partial [Ambispora leptoticha]